MATVSTLNPDFQSALSLCVEALKRVANYQLDPTLDHRLQELGERKEFLESGEHDELLALVTFARARTIEKLDAEHALRRLREACPDLASMP